MKAKAKKPTTRRAVIDRAETRAKARPKLARRPSVATARNTPKPEEAPVLRPGKAPDWSVEKPVTVTESTARTTIAADLEAAAPYWHGQSPIQVVRAGGGVFDGQEFAVSFASVTSALEAAAGLALPARECPDTAPAADTIESCTGVVGTALEAAAHEKAVIDEILYHLERRKKELQEELTLTLQACGLEATPVAVRGCVVRYVSSHTSRLDKGELLKHGVGAEVIEASTIKTEYAYAKVVVAGLERGKGAAAL